jgi:glycosyltransferase involved in cell wall biosynthesis
MAWSAAWGLTGVACVSDALRQACLQAGYPAPKLRVVHNGLPPASVSRPERPPRPFRLGYLGVFAERKGLRGLFEILDQLAQQSSASWELSLAGQAQEAEGHALVREIQERWSGRPWWPQVEWRGWVKRPLEFLASLDLLICPSSEFDPFPTVLLEAGQAGTAVLGARVGGVGEIVEDGVTGWLFEPRQWGQAAEKLREVLATPALAAEAGRRARQRVGQEFGVSSMVSGYIDAYGNLLHSRSRPGGPQDR